MLLALALSAVPDALADDPVADPPPTAETPAPPPPAPPAPPAPEPSAAPPAPPPTDGAHDATKEGGHDCKDGKCAHCKHGQADDAEKKHDCKDGKCDHGSKHDCKGGMCFPDDLAKYVQPVALLQVWGTAMDQDADAQADASGYGDPEDDPGLKLERFRVGLKGRTDHLYWKFVIGNEAPYDGLEPEQEAIEIEDAKVGFDPIDGVGLEVGKGRVPFSRDALMSAGELTFTERGVAAEHIAPERTLGASLHAARWGGKVQLGVYNSGGGIFGDDNAGKTFAGRLEYTLGKADPYAFWGGDKKEFALGIGASGFMTNDISTDTTALGADLMLRVMGASLMVDATMANLTPTNTTVSSPEVEAATERRGLTAQLSYQLWLLEPAVRYSAFEDSALGTYSQIHAGLASHLADDHVRIGAAYVKRLEGQSPVDNDTVRLWAQFKL